MEAIRILRKVINTIEREMAKNPAAFAQVGTSSLDRVLKSLSAVVDAASFSNDDRQDQANQAMHAAGNTAAEADADVADAEPAEELAGPGRSRRPTLTSPQR